MLDCITDDLNQTALNFSEYKGFIGKLFEAYTCNCDEVGKSDWLRIELKRILRKFGEDIPVLKNDRVNEHGAKYRDIDYELTTKYAVFKSEKELFQRYDYSIDV